MARDKVTITLDRSKARLASSLLRASSTSEVIDIALEQLIRRERLRRDIAAYRRTPPTGAEMALADITASDLDDETDWEAVYPEDGA